jgi:hypothetical protein
LWKVVTRRMKTKNRKTQIIFANCYKRLECGENYINRCKLFQPAQNLIM